MNKKTISVAFLSACLLAACETAPTLPSTTYLDGSKGKGLPVNMSPAQRLAFADLKMTKKEVIDVMGFPHASGSFPPNIECMSWIYINPKYQNISMKTNAIAIFKNGQLISSNPDFDRGCALTAFEFQALDKSSGN
jgi:outer membrane protein assembly factor BamE (lipoprotein component of BamABCDE complex)